MWAAVGCPSYGTLDNNCPLDQDHPTNKGIVSEWTIAPLPGWSGGLTLRDLARGLRSPNDGTLTNMAFPATSTSGWQPPARLGGYGSLAFDGTNDYVLCGNPATSFTAGLSVFGWFYFAAVNNNSTLIAKASGSEWMMDYGGGLFPRALVRNSGTGSGIIPVAGTLYHAGFTFDNTTITTYLNGLSKATATPGGGAVSGTAAITIGARASAANPFKSGGIDGVCIYNRAVSAGVVVALRDQQARGNPDRWRWAKPTVYFFPAVATGIQFDAASNSGVQSATSTYTWSHACTGSNRFLAVDVSLLSADQTVTGITYNGVALSLIGAQTTVTSFGRVECWGLVNPASGSNTIAVTISGSITSAGTAVSYTGVNQTSPTEAFNSTQATNGISAVDASVSITTVADNDWVHGAVSTNDGAITAGQTSRNNLSNIAGSAADEDTGPVTPAGAVTISYTGVDALKTWAIAGYAIRPIAAPPLTVDTFPSYLQPSWYYQYEEEQLVCI